MTVTREEMVAEIRKRSQNRFHTDPPYTPEDYYILTLLDVVDAQAQEGDKRVAEAIAEDRQRTLAWLRKNAVSWMHRPPDPHPSLGEIGMPPRSSFRDAATGVMVAADKLEARWGKKESA